MEKRNIAENFLGYVSAIQMKFLPDVIDVKLTRNDGQVELCYREHFTYLPKEIQDFMFPLTIKIVELFLKKMELDFNITQIEQGVEINMRGQPEAVVAHPLVEILMFGTTNMAKAEILANAMLKGLSVTSSGKVFRNFDDEAQKETEEALSKLRGLMHLAGVSNMKELMSFFDENMFDMMLQQFKQSSSSD